MAEYYGNMQNSYSNRPLILVTGANGQLGRELQDISAAYPMYEFVFVSRDELPIEDPGKLGKFFEEKQVDICVNCAAYTAVDQAETDASNAYLVNATAVGELARLCNHHQSRFIHISTDYVFNGQGQTPHTEEDSIAPVNVYGASKLKGEYLAFHNNASSLVIRTSWVYSRHGHNFVKTMLRLLKEKSSLNVVDDQYGCPTYAADLAAVIMGIISESKNIWPAGLLNYCNQGTITWYQFARAIKEIMHSPCLINPVPSSAYPTTAARPAFSVLDTGKIRGIYGLQVPEWRASLQKCLLTLA